MLGNGLLGSQVDPRAGSFTLVVISGNQETSSSLLPGQVGTEAENSLVAGGI
jgi:hypothetical protein